ncbi:hypothetical protein LMG23992_02283 [Cupriavidus laharis]|uniref:DUF985 domain-containing protein n=1 Tax=Cupriavidus laharis TaxID=151654 RepID=A0ABM8WYI0_9BURK|nr:cupin domain-containing protein [Cupriavidus laharis]CAG9172624.1 hypothetical protein LMG23992_02283 [Cupriavidus laharis]
MQADTTADRLIHALGLQPHPEGGYFRETYRSTEAIRCSDDRQRAASTAIYYLLRGNDFSAWHRIRSDELWHFHAGAPLDVHVLTGNGQLVTHRLGNPLEHPGAVFQAMVPANHWFAAERVASARDDFSLLGCTVAPGFEFSEFELADASRLAASFPDHAELVHRLSRRNA